MFSIRKIGLLLETHLLTKPKAPLARILTPRIQLTLRHRARDTYSIWKAIKRKCVNRVLGSKKYRRDYYRWIDEFEKQDDEFITSKLPHFQSRPLFSVIMPVYNTEPPELEAAIRSILNQSYERWELCIVDDASSRPEIKKILERFARQDSRIKIKFQGQRGGISVASNAALRMATGSYLAFLDHDDTFSPHALAWVCEALDRIPEADFFYSDEDKLDRRGNRFDPFFKPDWSPDLLLSENYIAHLLILGAELAQKVGPFSSDCDGSQDYDMILRAVEQAKRIEHLPKVLYHWRAGAMSTARSIENKSYALPTARTALTRYCHRQGKQMRVEQGRVDGRWRIRYVIPEQTKVSIIVPSGGKTDVLKANLLELFSKTEYPCFEVVVVDNSKADAIRSIVDQISIQYEALRYVDWRNKPFNYSTINNAAANLCNSPVLLFLNDDTSIIAPDWLRSMTELIARPEVGAVGAKLLYPDGRIQHGGVVMGLFENCGHAFKGLEGSVRHYFDFPDVIRNVSAVTGACLMTKSKVFWEVGGFDETDFPVAFNDVDLCLKIGSAGYRVLYTPHALLYHHEAFSKTEWDLVPHPREVNRMRSKWPGVIAHDPYYSPNLSRSDEDYSLRKR